VGVQEVLPGLFHWTAPHPRIGVPVSSYWLDGEGVLIDPLVPVEEGLEWFAARPTSPCTVVLSNRHHFRESNRFAERYGCSVSCSREGLHEFSAEQHVQGFAPGVELAGGIRTHSVDAICPDETALELPAQRAIVFADGVVRGGAPGTGGPLGFVPDSLMDDPPQTKRGLLAAFARLLADVDFDHLLLAHGGPVLGDGRALLQELVDSGGRTAFEL
jgi:hypothetical protein